ncbi:hypothetical protein [Streptomyces fragilis]|uniref:Uncharacterized protein n=1 Tax=Streptomyces fragilis TaxID=67301 RepID=A0ABV2YKU7_9ACTN|nr:hypothetical protein [Streptomyces fragilis]
MTPEKTTSTTAIASERPAGRSPADGDGPLGSLEVWARSAPIRLAGYEDDLAEPHILPSVD